ncbi:MAG: hypothetical protein H6662_17295 [Ardenticatenaceae bacterium]|nr:hypothetical protein [Anaerolineales bacterium]MCB8923346.1 hypothetical protein [Ardenticatenaceae bacterium]MCB9004654.1 hypothetical protein [Ardenticatenaceae bacterium]
MPDDLKSKIHNIRRDFDQDLFVERREELEFARQWQASSRRVLTITSPPANGKTWFLTHFQNLLQEEGQIIFKIDVTAFLLNGSLGKREIDHAALQKYVSDFAENLQEKCDSVPSTKATEDIFTTLTKVAGYASMHCWPEQPIYLFVDGGDEPSLAAWRIVEKQILEPIIAHFNWRLIIALRQSQRLYSSLLRRTEQRCVLKPLPSPINISQQGRDQLEKLISQSEEPDLPLTEILAMVPGYNWVHLGLNHFLFLEGRFQYINQQKPVANDLLKRGIMALMPLDNIDEILKHLQSISQLPPEWAVEELATRLDHPLSTVWETVQTLQDYMLITNIDNSYKITPGVQEFVRSLTPIRLRLWIDKDINQFAGNEFLSELSSILAVNSERIQLVSIERGSVTIILDIPQDYFIILLQRFIAQDSHLEKLRLLEIEPMITYGISLDESMQQGLKVENKKRLHQKFRRELRLLMEAHFDLGELRTLCFDLVIECENFEQKKNPIVIGIIEVCERNRKLASLLNYLATNKPKITWPAIN